MNYKYLLFDLDNTLLDFSKAEHEALTLAFNDFGIPLSDDLRQEYVELNDSLWKKHEKGLISREELLFRRFDILFRRIGCDFDPHTADNIYRGHLGECCFLVNGARETLEALSVSHEIYIITNGNLATQLRRLEKSGIEKFAKRVFISEQVGFQKPAKEFFDYVGAHIDGFSAKDALIIGDSLSSDIIGGMNAGIDTCYFDPAGCGASGSIIPTFTVRQLSEILNIV